MQFLCQQAPHELSDQLQRQGAYFAPRLASIRFKNRFWFANASNYDAHSWCNFAPK